MPVDIHGKSYVTVGERVKDFHKLFPNGSIVTEVIEFSDKRFLPKTTVIPDVKNIERCFTGYAYENIGIGNINKTSALENCETSSCGRALGFLGIGLDGSIATADEVSNAIEQQEAIKVTDNQKEEYQKLLTHKFFEGKKKETNDWWSGIYDTENPNSNANSCLKIMKQKIKQFENPKQEENK